MAGTAAAAGETAIAGSVHGSARLDTLVTCSAACTAACKAACVAVDGAGASVAATSKQNEHAQSRAPLQTRLLEDLPPPTHRAAMRQKALSVPCAVLGGARIKSTFTLAPLVRGLLCSLLSAVASLHSILPEVSDARGSKGISEETWPMTR